jgi:hypothetical protein
MLGKLVENAKHDLVEREGHASDDIISNIPLQARKRFTRIPAHRNQDNGLPFSYEWFFKTILDLNGSKQGQS